MSRVDFPMCCAAGVSDKALVGRLNKGAHLAACGTNPTRPSMSVCIRATEDSRVLGGVERSGSV